MLETDSASILYKQRQGMVNWTWLTERFNQIEGFKKLQAYEKKLAVQEK